MGVNVLEHCNEMLNLKRTIMQHNVENNKKFTSVVLNLWVVTALKFHIKYPASQIFTLRLIMENYSYGVATK